MIYSLILFLLIILLYHYDIKKHKRNRKAWLIIVQVIFILLAGLRYRIGTDTPNYINRFYHLYPTLSEFSFQDYPIGGDGPLYVLLNSLIITLGGKFYVVQLFQATFVILLIFNYFKKHSSYVFTCAFFYFIVCYIQFNFEIMRGSMCIAICLYANDYILEKKWLKAYILYIVALLFHVQAIMLFVMPLFTSLRLNIKGMVLLAGAFIAGIILQHAFGDVIEMLSFAEAVNTKAERYVDSDIFNSAGGNFYFYIVYIFPLFVYSFISLLQIRRKKLKSAILQLEPFMIMGLMALLFQMNLQILSRLVDFFDVYLIMIISECFVWLACKDAPKYSLSLIKTVVVFFPFVFLTFFGIYRQNYQRFIPYNSVFNRELNREREEAIYNPMIGPGDINEY